MSADLPAAGDSAASDGEDAPLADLTAPPVRTPGSRTRGGNNMNRGRDGILAGATSCLVRYGSRKTTMSDIAREGGVAKATVYNHFRAKPDVYAALAAAELDRLLSEIAALPAAPGTADALRDAVALAAVRVSTHPVVRAMREREPDVAARLAVPNPAGHGPSPWAAARQVLRERLSLAQAAGALHPRHDAEQAVDTLLRWITSHVLWPSEPATVIVAAHALVRGFAAPPYAGARNDRP